MGEAELSSWALYPPLYSPWCFVATPSCRRALPRPAGACSSSCPRSPGTRCLLGFLWEGCFDTSYVVVVGYGLEIRSRKKGDWGVNGQPRCLGGALYALFREIRGARDGILLRI